jgi:hypothetical protein
VLKEREVPTRAFAVRRDLGEEAVEVRRVVVGSDWDLVDVGEDDVGGLLEVRVSR